MSVSILFAIVNIIFHHKILCHNSYILKLFILDIYMTADVPLITQSLIMSQYPLSRHVTVSVPFS